MVGRIGNKNCPMFSMKNKNAPAATALAPASTESLISCNEEIPPI